MKNAVFAGLPAVLFSLIVRSSLAASFGDRSVADVEFVGADGKTSVREMPLEQSGRTVRFRLRQSEVPDGTKAVKVTPGFARARKGEDGYWVFSGGVYGTYRLDTGSAYSNRIYHYMPVHGMKTPRGTFVAIVTGQPWGASFRVTARKGEYRMTTEFDDAPGRDGEDIAIEYRFLEGADADYSGMAREYRRYQLERGACRPIAARAKERRELDYAIRAPEIRIRMAWKPVPSPVTNQVQRMNEPPVKPVVTFDRAGDFAAALKRAGVGEAELCLVGWNRGGHDGTYPQLFPVEPVLGGEARLKANVRRVQDLGYQIVGHGNHRDAYMIADCWDAEYVMEKNPDGTLRKPTCTWGGGGLYTICSRRSYERFAGKTAAAVASLGFRGLYYLDVTSSRGPFRCTDPRHPMTARQCAQWETAILAVQRETFGGAASEGGADFCIGELDSALTIGWGKPFEPQKKGSLVDGYIPFWQLVYHGICLSTPFRSSMNTTLYPERKHTLKLAEFGGRPTFYVHSHFLWTGKSNMGDDDLELTDDAKFDQAVRCVKAGYDEYVRRRDLQYAFMDRHEKVRDGVFRIAYSNGAKMYVNYNPTAETVDGVTVPAEDYAVVGADFKQDERNAK